MNPVIAERLTRRLDSIIQKQGTHAKPRQNLGNTYPLSYPDFPKNKSLARPIVIGAPRSGFTLTIGVTNAILNLHRQKFPFDPDSKWRMALRKLVDIASIYLTQQYRKTFENHGLIDQLVFNGEFHLIVGGPKWLDKENPARVGVRKYLGVKGQGDFLMNTFFPREVLEYYDVTHSHIDPPLWLEQTEYQNHTMIASVRNPIGIINSSSFSLNAMASEYIQLFNEQNISQDFIRQRHGLFKLSDLNFIQGLGVFLKKYLDQFLSVRNQYTTMRWEELIQSPGATISKFSERIGLPVSVDQAEAIWKPMDHQNTLQYHKHNFRRGKGIVGDWKNSLVNEHFEVLRELNFDHYLEELGYPKIPELNPRDYSPYQKLVASHIQRGEIYRNVGDMDLFGFAFNKSNIDASKFNFQSLPEQEWTHVERTTVKNQKVVEAVSQIAEQGCAKVNNIFQSWIDVRNAEARELEKVWIDLEKRCDDLALDINSQRFLEIIKAHFREINQLYRS